jgi:uncharacterized membrane-anchored protein
MKRTVMVVVLALAATASASDRKPTPKAEKTPEAKVDEKPDVASDGAGSDAEQPLPPHIEGPKLVDLGNDLEIDLPTGAILFERDVVRQLAEKQGAPTEGLVAWIGRRDADWQIVIHYNDAGYITDSDADQLDADELLAAFREGTALHNEKRKQLGVPELFIDGWSERPRYERTAHHLVWGVNVHNTDGPAINYFTRILGRRGFASVNLIDDAAKIESSKRAAAPLLGAIRFRPGARYADHQSSDKDSDMSLRNLVLGGTGVAIAAKTGLLMKILLVLKKGILLVVIGIGGFFRWLFRRKRHDETPPAPPEPPAPAPT